MNPIIEGRRADSDRRRQRVTKALADAITHNTGITVSGIAKAAAVDRSFLYRHSDLLGQVHAAAAKPHPTAQDGSQTSRASLQADLANAQQRVSRQQQHIHRLEAKLSTMLGAQAWNESGLGAPANVDQLERRVTELEQNIVELTSQLDEREQELDAARAANRELMTRINTAQSGGQ